MILPIRCCCEPSLVLGMIAVPDHFQAGNVLALQERPQLVRESSEPSLKTPDPVNLTLAWFHKGFDHDGVPRRQLAVKSDEVPLERLRQMVGFIEVNKRLDMEDPFFVGTHSVDQTVRYRGI